ncbi:MAG: hypothetical protein JW940_08180 [Polyangiaceae bacterium]|nr:hypothetical protein [Polyangiaceae bacterium]
MARAGAWVLILASGLSLLACHKNAARRPAAAPHSHQESSDGPDSDAGSDTEGDEPLVPPPDNGGYAPVE